MPGVPSQWVVGGQPTDAMVNASRLNYDMYTYDSNAFHPTGVYFHTYRPIFSEVLYNCNSATLLSSAAGAQTNLYLLATNIGGSIYDTSGLWGAGADFILGNYQFLPTVPGSDGNGNIGGYHVMCHFIEASGSVATSDRMAGILGYNDNTALVAYGNFQPMITNHNNCAFVMDLIPTGPNSPFTGNHEFDPVVEIQDTGAGFYHPMSTTTNASGEYSREFTFWQCVNGANQASYGTQSSIGTPTASWPVGTNITSTLMQNALADPLMWLSNPVSFRTSTTTSTAVAANTPTVVSFPTGGTTITNNPESHWNGATSTFTVPVAGLYLLHGVVTFASSSAANSFNAGFQINSTNYWGPTVAQTTLTGGVTGATKTQVFSLAAGDTIKLVARNSATLATASLAGANRFFVVYIGGNGATTGGTIGVPTTTYTVPDVSFRWQAGTPAALLQQQFQQHLGNDIGFLFNKPYFLGYQSASTALAVTGTWSGNINLQQQKGLVHGENGDPWSGWDGTNFRWSPPVAGWYLVCTEQFVSVSNTPLDGVAGIGATTSGGLVPTSTPNWYQHIRYQTGTPPMPNGSTGIDMFYLDPAEGDKLFIQSRQDGQTAATSTATPTVTGTNQFTTHLEIVWMGV